MTKRDHFSPATIRILRDRAGNHCSNPDCARPTSGPAKDSADESTIAGVASHICAAMPGGPRFDPDMDNDIRHSVDNGSWLCEMCAALIDKNDGVGYSIQLLMEWKHKAERKARTALERPTLGVTESFPAIQAVSYVNLPRLIDMAQRRGITTEWPTLDPAQWLHDLGGNTRMVMSLAQEVLRILQ